MWKYRSLQERLILNSHKEKSLHLPEHCGHCQVWDGYTQDGYRTEKEGYGRINLTYEGRSLKFPVHRVALVLHEILTINPRFDFYNKEDKLAFFELYFAYSQARLTVDHVCNNSLCFNPGHLEWVWLSINEKRKKWKKKERRRKALSVVGNKTRHRALVLSMPNISSLVYWIKQRSYRTKA